jgi:hypothetical protein
MTMFAIAHWAGVPAQQGGGLHWEDGHRYRVGEALGDGRSPLRRAARGQPANHLQHSLPGRERPKKTEPVFVNVYGAQKSRPRHRFS